MTVESTPVKGYARFTADADRVVNRTDWNQVVDDLDASDATYFPSTVVTTATITALQAALDTTDAGTVVVPPGMTITLSAQVTIPSDVTLFLSEGALLERTWSSTSGDKQVSATIINENAPTWATYLSSDPYVPGTLDTNIRIVGPGKIGMSSALRTTIDGDSNQRCPVIYMVGVDDLVIDDVTLDTGGRDWSITVHGDRCRIGDNLKILGGEYVFEDGIHVMGGSDGVIGSPYIESGDDAIAFGSNYDNAIDNWNVGQPTVKSNRGNAFKVVRVRSGATAGSGAFTTECRGISVDKITGQGGTLRNGLVVVAEDANGAGTILDVDITFDLIQNATGSHDTVNDQAVWLSGGKGRIRGRVRNPVERIVLLDGPGGDWVLDIDADASQTSGARVVDIDEADRVVLNGRLVASAGANPVVDVADCPQLEIDNLTVSDIRNGQAAIRMAGAGDHLSINFLRVLSEASATSARGVEFTAAATATINRLEGDVDRPIASGGTAAWVRRNDHYRRSRTIGTGALSTQGESVLALLAEGGVSDTIATIANGYVGQFLTLVNGEASPASVTIGVQNSGNISVGSTRTLDAAGESVIVRWNGTKWTEVHNGTT